MEQGSDFRKTLKLGPWAFLSNYPHAIKFQLPNLWRIVGTWKTTVGNLSKKLVPLRRGCQPLTLELDAVNHSRDKSWNLKASSTLLRKSLLFHHNVSSGTLKQEYSKEHEKVKRYKKTKYFFSFLGLKASTHNTKLGNIFQWKETNAEEK